MRLIDAIPWFISLAMLVLNIVVFSTNRGDKVRQEDNDVHTALLKLNMKCDQICTTTNETRSDIKAMDKDLRGLDSRVTVLERDVKTAFVKIDEIKETQHEH